MDLDLESRDGRIWGLAGWGICETSLALGGGIDRW